MALLETVIRLGTRAAQPAADAVAVGTLYAVSDEDLVERSNGTTWEAFGGSGGLSQAEVELLLVPLEYDLGEVSGATTVTWGNGTQQHLVLTGDTTLTFAGGQAGGTYRLVIEQDVSGGHAVTWPADVHWEDGATPTLVTTASTVALASFLYTGAGSSGYIGFATTRAITI